MSYFYIHHLLVKGSPTLLILETWISDQNLQQQQQQQQQQKETKKSNLMDLNCKSIRFDFFKCFKVLLLIKSHRLIFESMELKEYVIHCEKI